MKQKEESMDDLIKELAKSMIMESNNYFEKEIIDQSIQEIDNMKEKKTKTAKKEKTKKGA